MNCIHLDCYPDLRIIPLCQPIASNKPDCSTGPKIGLVCKRHILSSANPITNSKFKLYFVCSTLFILTCSMAIVAALPPVSASRRLVIVPLQAMGQSCHRCNWSCCGTSALRTILLLSSLSPSAITAALAAQCRHHHVGSVVSILVVSSAVASSLHLQHHGRVIYVVISYLYYGSTSCVASSVSSTHRQWRPQRRRNPSSELLSCH